MQNLPVLFMCLFGPTPEITLPDSRRLICREIFVQVKAVGSDLINDEFHLMLVMSNRCASVDLRRKVSRSNFGLSHGHVAHLRAIEVCAIANCVYPLTTVNAHRRSHVDVTLFICDPDVRSCRGPSKWRHKHEQIELDRSSTPGHGGILRQ